MTETDACKIIYKLDRATFDSIDADGSVTLDQSELARVLAFGHTLVRFLVSMLGVLVVVWELGGERGYNCFAFQRLWFHFVSIRVRVVVWYRIVVRYGSCNRIDT